MLEVGEGWHPLIEELIEELYKLGWDGNVVQIKEKFGGLRFYIHGETEAMVDKIDEYEDKSFEICEKCGEPGIPKGRRWIKTLCDKHHEEFNSRR